MSYALAAGVVAALVIVVLLALLAPSPLYRDPSPKLVEEVIDGPS